MIINSHYPNACAECLHQLGNSLETADSIFAVQLQFQPRFNSLNQLHTEFAYDGNINAIFRVPNVLHIAGMFHFQETAAPRPTLTTYIGTSSSKEYAIHGDIVRALACGAVRIYCNANAQARRIHASQTIAIAFVGDSSILCANHAHIAERCVIIIFVCCV